jgi:hypothetical protein
MSDKRFQKMWSWKSYNLRSVSNYKTYCLEPQLIEYNIKWKVMSILQIFLKVLLLEENRAFSLEPNNYSSLQKCCPQSEWRVFATTFAVSFFSTTWMAKFRHKGSCQNLSIIGKTKESRKSWMFLNEQKFYWFNKTEEINKSWFWLELFFFFEFLREITKKSALPKRDKLWQDPLWRNFAIHVVEKTDCKRSGKNSPLTLRTTFLQNAVNKLFGQNLSLHRC